MADTENTQEEKVRVVKLHHLRPAPGAKKARTRVGRGEASKGKTAGRGTKGTKARYQVRPGFEGGQMPLHMRLPKLRGFRNPNRVEYQPVNVGRIAELFPEGGTVTVEGPRRQGRGAQEPARQGPRRRRRHRGPDAHGRRLVRLRQGEDRGRRRQHRHALNAVGPSPARVTTPKERP